MGVGRKGEGMVGHVEPEDDAPRRAPAGTDVRPYRDRLLAAASALKAARAEVDEFVIRP